jgi:hypothetical protein
MFEARLLTPRARPHHASHANAPASPARRRRVRFLLPPPSEKKKKNYCDPARRQGRRPIAAPSPPIPLLHLTVAGSLRREACASARNTAAASLQTRVELSLAAMASSPGSGALLAGSARCFVGQGATAVVGAWWAVGCRVVSNGEPINPWCISYLHLVHPRLGLRRHVTITGYLKPIPFECSVASLYIRVGLFPLVMLCVSIYDYLLVFLYPCVLEVRSHRIELLL